MINKTFNRKFKRILSISSLGALCCSQVIHADSADSLRSTSLYFKECLLDTVYRNSFNDGHVNGITAGGCSRSGTRWEVHKSYDATRTTGEKWVYLTYKDDNTPKTDIILWKFDYDKAIVLPGNERIWDVLEKYHNARPSWEHLKLTKEMEDIAWDQGTEAFVNKLENQIAQERKKREEKEKKEVEKQVEKRQKEEQEDKRSDKLLMYGIPLGILTIALTAGISASIARSSQNNQPFVYIR